MNHVPANLADPVLDQLGVIPPYVEAPLHYVAQSVERLRSYTYDPPEGVARSNIVPETHVVPIYSLRPIASELTLDREGFELLHRPTAMGDFYDESQIRQIYYPETERLIAEATGASRVFIFDHTVRRRVWGADDRVPGQPRQPAGRVHVDHTAKSGAQRVRDLLGAEAEDLLKGRVQVINVWRPIRGPLRDAPLAVADAQSVDPEDLVPQDLIYRDRTGEIYGLTYNPAHRWYYAPAMRADEALLLKCYDSMTDGRARFMPHTSFAHPNAPADALPRESIELRTLVFFDA